MTKVNIKGTVSGDITEEQFMDDFIVWLESKGLTFFGFSYDEDEKDEEQ